MAPRLPTLLSDALQSLSGHRRIHRALAGVAALSALAILLAALWMWRTADALAPLVDAGQVEGEMAARFLRICPEVQRGPRHRPLDIADPSCIGRYFEEMAPHGLRYVRYIPPGNSQHRGGAANNPDLERGERLSPPGIEEDPAARGRPVILQEGERHLYMLPPRPAPPGSPSLLIEYEPLRLNAHRRLGRFTLLAGLMGSASILLGALLLSALVKERLAYAARIHAQEQFALLGQMSAVLAHDLRSPLASAKGRAELVAEMLPPESPLSPRAQSVVSEIGRVQAVTQALLAFIRSGKAHRQPWDPVALAQETALRVQGRVEVEVQGDIPRWSLDRFALERALTNLLNNALQAQGSAAPPITLGVAIRRGALSFTVDDHGPGFPAEVALGTFLVTTRPQGTGLGLATSFQTARAHGGELILGKSPSGGARVELRIPRGEGHGEDPTTPPPETFVVEHGRGP